MASAAPPGYQQMSTPSTGQANFGIMGPGYNSVGCSVPQRNDVVTTTPQQMEMQGTQPGACGPTVVVTVTEPPTTCGLVVSVLSSIFCCIICGFTGMVFSWKARMYVLNNKLEHARHSLVIVWILFGFAIFFGIITWIVVVIYCIFGTRYLFASYSCSSNGCYYRV
ncbi:uncharacterized protein LOC112553211 [Pomacea canaliculata]|uniref:uncharacterized protein LOC112553211 n=1 Tax=Pomacea canaliculata TaxID=400727 RepID=UPI000D7341B2|nr:uncharacterized protein LOC112553211 [Pomacea canaliculata]